MYKSNDNLLPLAIRVVLQALSKFDYEVSESQKSLIEQSLLFQVMFLASF